MWSIVQNSTQSYFPPSLSLTLWSLMDMSIFVFNWLYFGKLKLPPRLPAFNSPFVHGSCYPDPRKNVILWNKCAFNVQDMEMCAFGCLANSDEMLKDETILWSKILKPMTIALRRLCLKAESGIHSQNLCKMLLFDSKELHLVSHNAIKIFFLKKILIP